MVKFFITHETEKEFFDTQNHMLGGSENNEKKNKMSKSYDRNLKFFTRLFFIQEGNKKDYLLPPTWRDEFKRFKDEIVSF